MVINIDQKKFDNITKNPLNYINNKWFINLTNITIPPSVSTLLQLDDNLPLDNNKKIAIHEFIKNIESYNISMTRQKSVTQLYPFSIILYIKNQ